MNLENLKFAEVKGFIDTGFTDVYLQVTPVNVTLEYAEGETYMIRN